MRVGILGGTFDPPHEAHRILACAAIGELALDRLLVIPSGEPPHKRCLAAPGDRLAMARAAFADFPGVLVSDIEVARPGETYAVDTVRELRGACPGAELIYVLGADALGRLPQWFGFEELRAMCGFACAARAGQADFMDGITRIGAEIPNLSSSEIRARVCAGGEIAEDVPPGVASIIAERGLYLADRTEEALIADLSVRLSGSRMRHTLGVRDTATRLARLNHLPAGKARIAGLLHDCAKNLSDAELKALADAAGADAEEKRNPQVLHAPVGAMIARDRYGVRDREVLSAIRRHTVGGAGITVLEAVVYTADFVEPNRRDFEGLSRVRELAYADLWQGASECARLTAAYAEGRGHGIHPATREMVAWIEGGRASLQPNQ